MTLSSMYAVGWRGDAICSRLQAALNWCAEKSCSINPMKAIIVLFAKRWMINLTFSLEAKYLEMTQDKILNSRSNLTTVTNKATK